VTISGLTGTCGPPCSAYNTVWNLTYDGDCVWSASGASSSTMTLTCTVNHWNILLVQSGNDCAHWLIDVDASGCPVTGAYGWSHGDCSEGNCSVAEAP